MPIYEVGEHLGQSYFSMKLIEGGSLSQRLGEFTSDPRRSAELLAATARAVHHAHQRGILHRDLKPSNILLDRDGRPLVTDFGLVKRPEVESGLTLSGAVVGTPQYMPPEQAFGKKGDVTTSADVYGLGAVLYTLLTGKPPFLADSVAEVLEKVRNQPPQSPRGVSRRVDRDLETVCMKCLEKDPRQRYGSAEAVADELERWIRGEPIIARPVGRAERAWRWCRRNPVVAVLSATVLLLTALGVTGLAVSRAAISHERDNVEYQRRKVVASLAVVKDQRDSANQNFYIAQVSVVREVWESGDIGRAEGLLDALVPRAGQADLRGWEWYYLRALCHGERLTFRDAPGANESLAWSPDGRRLAAAGDDGQIIIRDVGTGRTAVTIRGSGNVVTAALPGVLMARASPPQPIGMDCRRRSGSGMR